MQTYSRNQTQQNGQSPERSFFSKSSETGSAIRPLHPFFSVQRSLGNQAIQRMAVKQREKTDRCVMRQEGQGAQPESLTHSMDPSQMTEAQLDREIGLIRAWLARQTTGTEETARMTEALSALSRERRQRGTYTPSTPASAPPATMLPPRPNTGGVNAPAAPAPSTTRTDRPPGNMVSLQPSAATQNRLMQIITQGGPMPEGTRVIGAAIIEVEGYKGPREIRAISSAQTDDLGQGAPVAHAQSPASRELSASRSIGNASVRREFPFSHVNDAEIKMFEEIIRNMPPNARGRISFTTMRSRQGGQIIEPIPACSSCNNATFQLAGRFRNVQVASYAAVHPTGTLNMGPSNRLPNPPVSGASAPRTGSPQTTATGPGRSGEGLRSEIGTPDMRGLNVGGPSARGEGIGAGITVAFMGANVVLNMINDSIQENRVKKALADMEPGLLQQRRANPGLGFLLVFHYSQVRPHPDSLIQPGAAFSHIELSTGRTLDEARINRSRTTFLRPGLGPNTREVTQETWIPPAAAPGIGSIQTPFSRFATGTFAGAAVLQNVEWGGIDGFDDEGTTNLQVPAGVQPRFIILTPPPVIRFFNGGFQHSVTIPVARQNAAGGGQVPVVSLDPDMPGFNVSAACVFPADDATDALFMTARATKDNLGQLRVYPNFGKARWVRPANIRVLDGL